MTDQSKNQKTFWDVFLQITRKPFETRLFKELKKKKKKKLLDESLKKHRKESLGWGASCN